MASMMLSRIIRDRARRRTIRFIWCARDFMEMCPIYREARKKYTKSSFDSCAWCNHVFRDGEMMSLAQPIKGKNKLLCRTCADELLNGE